MAFKVTVHSFLNPEVQTRTFVFSGSLNTHLYVATHIQNHFGAYGKAVSIYAPSQGLPYSSETVAKDIVKTPEKHMKQENVVLFLVDQFQDIVIGKEVIAEFRATHDHGNFSNKYIQLCYMAPVSVVRSLIYHKFLSEFNEIKNIHFSFYLDEKTIFNDFEKEKEKFLFFQGVNFGLLSNKERTFFQVSFQSPTPPSPVVETTSLKLDQVPTSGLIREIERRTLPRLAILEEEIESLRQELRSTKVATLFCTKARKARKAHSRKLAFLGPFKKI